jgi:NTE family protein
MNKISLALGGGGTKGFAHIGVISRLLLHGYKPAAIAGTSAGGIVGALYAAGYTPEEIKQFSEDLDYTKIFTRNADSAPSLLGLGGLYKLLSKYLGDKTFENANIPFAVVAVDNNSGKEFIIQSGKLIDAVKATTAVPGIFPPFILGEHKFVDGAILNPVPVNIVRWLNENFPVVAISLSAPPNQWNRLPKYTIPEYMPIPQFIVQQFTHMRLGQAVETFTDSLELMTNMIAWLRLQQDKPDILINPKVYHHTMIDNVDVNEMVELGEKAVEESLDQFKNLFKLGRRAERWLRASKTPAEILEI